MAKRMLIDAAHPEETRVVVLSGNRLEEFDFESSTKKHVKGNIYLAKITRVEPSLQAAFVDYGNHRHGFLAFSEIHPDYYKIPVGDRDVAEVEQLYEETRVRESPTYATEGEATSLEAALPEPVPVPIATEGGEDELSEPAEPLEPESRDSPHLTSPGTGAERENGAAAGEPHSSVEIVALPWEIVASVPETASEAAEPMEERAEDASPLTVALVSSDEAITSAGEFSAPALEEESLAAAEEAVGNGLAEGEGDATEAVETLGGDELEEEAEHQRSRTFRHYKIQEVIKRRQIMLVQVTKEERGNKGAALTTYLSLAGRYCVLMPNTARGGGVSRKITNMSDRRRLKDILEELDIPEGMGVIVRTAGAERSKAEIKRDYEYLLRLWNEIRDLTLRSTAPALIYEEGDLIKRSIRDLYTRDIDEVLVEGEEGYRTAKAFMKMLMPSHAKRVQPYRDSQIGLFHRFQVESQIDAIHSPIVQLRSGGYVVINQTEALVAIDVNSGRATRERNIEETAVRTNLEAAEEIARQLRLRDLAGLIVIDFIDMEEHRNQIAVERRLKEALKNDRARIQVGRISAFGLLEMSRQRLRPSLVETSTQPCPHCGGTGFIRSTESTALYVLRSIEEEGMRRRSAEICVYVPTTVALYILNQKRDSLVQLEERYDIQVLVARDDALIPPAFRLERLRAYSLAETTALPAAPLTQTPISDEEEEEEIEEAAELAPLEEEADQERGRSRRRRRRRRRAEEEAVPASTAPAAEAAEESSDDESEFVAEDGRADTGEGEGDDESEAERRRRRRGRRGGRRRGRREPGVEPSFTEPRPASDTVEILPTPEAQEAEEAEPAMAEADNAWPVEVAGVAIETASLPALAGEADEDAAPQRQQVSSDEQPAAAGGNNQPAAPQTAEVEQRVPYISEAERDLETTSAGAEEDQKPPPHPVSAWPVEVAGVAIETASLPALAGEADEDAAPQRQRVSSDEEPAAAGGNDQPAAPPTAEAERELETASAGAEEEQKPLPHPVQSVTEKPANPRRGWWQRLIQP
jgi:ribonuclease E